MACTKSLVIGDIRPKESCRFFNPNDRKEAWECLRGPDPDFRLAPIPDTDSEGRHQSRPSSRNQSRISEPVDSLDEARHHDVSALNRLPLCRVVKEPYRSCSASRLGHSTNVTIN